MGTNGMSAPKPHEHMQAPDGPGHLLKRLRPLALPLTFLSGPLLGTLLVAGIFGLPGPLIVLATAVFGLSFAILLWLAWSPSRAGAKSPRS